MEQRHTAPDQDLPFPVPDYRFDQKNEMFKRARWDEKMQSLAKRFYMEVKYKESDGYQKIDYALRNASWNLEWGAGFGNSCSNTGLYAWEGVPEKIRHFVTTGGAVQEAPDKMSRLIKSASRFFGASRVGICRVHPNWVYSHEYNLLSNEHYPIELPEGCDYAVVMAVEMDYDAMRSAPNGVGGAATGLGYSKMVFIANMLAAFIRGIGYRAVPCGNDTALSIPLAMAAGLGEASRMGLLITQKFGPRVRLCKVFTDLPLEIDHYRPFGVEAFCRTCRKCADQCPSHAIPHGEMTTEAPSISNQSGALKWYVNPENCFSFWSANRMDCSICIRVCPFNKPAGFIHDMTRAVIRNTAALNKFFVWIDDVLGYGTQSSTERFWN